MKKLIKLVLFLMVAYPLTGAILSACSEESDCSMTGRPMVYAKMYTINPETKAVLNDTLDSLSVTAFGTVSLHPVVKRYDGDPANQYSLLSVDGLRIQYETKYHQYSSD